MLATRHDPLDAARSWFRYRRLLAGLLQPELRRVPSKRKPRSLYAKLGAHSRAGAPERARALGRPHVSADSAAFRSRGLSAVRNHPNRVLAPHPDGVQAGNGSSPGGRSFTVRPVITGQPSAAGRSDDQ